MYTLLIVTMLMAGSKEGGASVTTDSINYNDRALCESERAKVETDGQMFKNNFSGIAFGNYKIIAKCIQLKRD